MRGGAHHPAVEVARADEPVEHLRADHAGVEHGRALGHRAVAGPRGQLRRGLPHVPPQADAQLARRLAGQSGEHSNERPAQLLGDVGVDLVRIDAADVVGLEDPGIDGGRALHAGHPSPPRPGSTDGDRASHPRLATRS